MRKITRHKISTLPQNPIRVSPTMANLLEKAANDWRSESMLTHIEAAQSMANLKLTHIKAAQSMANLKVNLGINISESFRIAAERLLSPNPLDEVIEIIKRDQSKLESTIATLRGNSERLQDAIASIERMEIWRNVTKEQYAGLAAISEISLIRDAEIISPDMLEVWRKDKEANAKTIIDPETPTIAVETQIITPENSTADTKKYFWVAIVYEFYKEADHWHPILTTKCPELFNEIIILLSN